MTGWPCQGTPWTGPINRRFSRNTRGSHRFPFLETFRCRRKSFPKSSEKPAAEGLPKPLDVETLSQLLLLSYTYTARARYLEGDFLFRSAASAGALYPTEMYVAVRDVKSLDDGIYHFALRSHSFDLLRKGEVTEQNRGVGSRITFFLTAIFFRSAWKYRARAYRYHLMDTGHVAENLILALKASKLPFSVAYDFDDGEVNRLLGLDDQKEVALAIIDVPGDKGTYEKPKGPVSPLSAIRLASQPCLSKGNRLSGHKANPRGGHAQSGEHGAESLCSKGDDP